MIIVAFGCSLTLSLAENPTATQIRKWTVPIDFKTKTDAKIAVICMAGKEAIEFVRFRGGPVPDDHQPFLQLRKQKEGKLGSKAGESRSDTTDIKVEDVQRIGSVSTSASPPPSKLYAIGNSRKGISGLVKLGIRQSGDSIYHSCQSSKTPADRNRFYEKRSREVSPIHTSPQSLTSWLASSEGT